jgi:hypothetical protein
MSCNIHDIVIDQLNSFAATLRRRPSYTYKIGESFQNSEESEGIWRDGPVITVNVLCNTCESSKKNEYIIQEASLMNE